MSVWQTDVPIPAPDQKCAALEQYPNILVIDDDQVLLNLFDQVLRKLGFRVAAANNGNDAIDLVRKTSPDVVLLDIKLPGADGITVLKKIKEKDPDIEVIIITGFASLDSAVEALKFGAYDYIQKPFRKLEQVVDAVRRAWERRQPYLEKRNRKASLERKIFELQILYKISRIIAYCSDHQEMVTQMLDSLNQIISYDLAIFLLVEESQAKEMVLQVVKPSSYGFVKLAKYSLIEAFNSATYSILSTETEFDRVLGKENLKVIDTNQTADDHNPIEPALAKEARELNSLLNVPLVSNGRIQGMINVSSHLDRAFGPNDIRLIYTVASQFPPAIEKFQRDQDKGANHAG